MYLMHHCTHSFRKCIKMHTYSTFIVFSIFTDLKNSCFMCALTKILYAWVTGCRHVPVAPTPSHQSSARSHRLQKLSSAKQISSPSLLFDERHLHTVKLCNFQSRWKRRMLCFSAAAGLIFIYRSKKRSWRPEIKANAAALPKLQATLTLLIKLICTDAAYGDYVNEDYLKTINCGTIVSTFSQWNCVTRSSKTKALLKISINERGL